MENLSIIQAIEKNDLSLINGTKKELTKQAQDYVKQLMDDGFVSPNNVIADAGRLSHFFTEVLKQAKEHYDHNTTSAKGVEITERNGGSTLNYSEDWKVAELEKQLKERKELVKTASNSKEPIYDSEGIEVTKVSVSYRKNSIVLEF